MAAKGGKNVKRAAGDLLDSLGIKGNFQNLIRKAVIQGWSADEFAQALLHTRAFRRAFPGLVKDGVIHIDFGGGASASDLITATRRYNQGFDDMKTLAKNYGFNLHKKGFGALIRGDNSAEEFGVKLGAAKALKDNPQLMDQFNEQLKYQGDKALDKTGMLRFLAGTADSKFYDTYEAAYLRNQGLDLNTEQAQGLAGKLGTPGQLTDLNALMRAFNEVKPDVGPELRRAGIDDARAALILAGQDPTGEAFIRQLVNQRRARPGQGSYAQQSSTGGYSLYPQDEATY